MNRYTKILVAAGLTFSVLMLLLYAAIVTGEGIGRMVIEQ